MVKCPTLDHFQEQNKEDIIQFLFYFILSIVFFLFLIKEGDNYSKLILGQLEESKLPRHGKPVESAYGKKKSELSQVEESKLQRHRKPVESAYEKKKKKKSELSQVQECKLPQHGKPVESAYEKKE